MLRRILVLNGHPGQTSLSNSLSIAYADAAKAAGHEVRIVQLHDMSFDADFGQARYAQSKPLEPALKAFVADLQWSQHLVLAMPLWWGGMPAKLKGLFDRVLLPGFAFDPRNKRMGLPKPLLAGRSARVIITSDTPGWALALLYRGAVMHQIRRQILGFVGISPARFSHFPLANAAPPARVTAWLQSAHDLGARGI